MGILQHTLGIMTNPANEWKAIRGETNSSIQVFVSHVPFLALIPSVCAFIGVTQVGWQIGGGAVVKLSYASAATLCSLTFVAILAAVYVLGEFIHWMSRTYGVEDPEQKRHYESMALAVYVATPVLIAGVANLYPQLWVVAIAMGLGACYATYLVYEGIPILMNIDKERGFMYATSVITVALVLAVTLMMLTVVTWGMGVGPVYID
jgi:hypothetical protein